MENEIIKVNETGNIIVADKFIKEIQKQHRKKVEAEIYEEKLKNSLLIAMEKYGVKKYESLGGEVIATYVEGREGVKFNTTKFKEENPELYESYQTPTTTKPYVKVTIK